jgi:hypothetical protein
VASSPHASTTDVHLRAGTFEAPLFFMPAVCMACRPQAAFYGRLIAQRMNASSSRIAISIAPVNMSLPWVGSLAVVAFQKCQWPPLSNVPQAIGSATSEVVGVERASDSAGRNVDDGPRPDHQPPDHIPVRPAVRKFSHERDGAGRNDGSDQKTCEGEKDPN